MDIDDKGQESNPSYTAYVMPTFNLEREDLNEYRIPEEMIFDAMPRSNRGKMLPIIVKQTIKNKKENKNGN